MRSIKTSTTIKSSYYDGRKGAKEGGMMIEVHRDKNKACALYLA